MFHDWYDTRKAAQVVAFFAGKSGGRINVLKLVKLVYLGDRENMKRFGFPVTNDNFVSMPQGPVNTMTLNCLNGGGRDAAAWDEFVRPRDNYDIGTARTFGVEDFDELSPVEIESLEAVWAEFGTWDKWRLVKYTHDKCPEWEDPDGSSQPIPHSRVFKYLGFEDADERAHGVQAEREVENFFASLRV